MQEISQAVPQTSPDVPPAPRIKNSLLVIMAVALLFATSLAGLFYFQIQKLSKQLSKYQIQASPTPTATTDPTANWKTYTNTLYKFSHKYPPQAETKEIITQADNNRRVLFAIDTSEVGATQIPNTEFYDRYNFTIVIVEKSPTETIDDISSEYISNCNKVGDLIKSPESTIVNGVRGITHSCRGLGESTYILLLAPKTNSYYFEIRTSHERSNKANYQKMIDQILSTFKFLEATPSASPISN